ncbi:hypothetical protein CEXT_510091 [Caerostris extrusa]|uniref:Uncharacterized protein n=1 Tax=Caerostris extrusa TaxID=172846 RepID=A0AAV4XMR2_CAEEX|nr:hypothetical protein CEXT_510091 [Caerostris extrusa]
MVNFSVNLRDGVERARRVGVVIVKIILKKFPVGGSEFRMLCSLDTDMEGDDYRVVIRRRKFRERLNSIRKVKIVCKREVDSGSRVMAKASRCRGSNDISASVSCKSSNKMQLLKNGRDIRCTSKHGDYFFENEKRFVQFIRVKYGFSGRRGRSLRRSGVGWRGR